MTPSCWSATFENYSAFEGDVPRHQRDYFILTSWFYFSPLMSDLRSLALIEDSDIIRYPQFCVVFGKSNCGKTTLIDTLMMSMFRRVHTIEKRQFTTAKLRGLQETYKRFPVVFDDIGKTAFNAHGKGHDQGRASAQCRGVPLLHDLDEQRFPLVSRRGCQAQPDDLYDDRPATIRRGEQAAPVRWNPEYAPKTHRRPVQALPSWRLWMRLTATTCLRTGLRSRREC